MSGGTGYVSGQQVVMGSNEQSQRARHSRNDGSKLAAELLV
jgi:hypothetical protein